MRYAASYQPGFGNCDHKGSFRAAHDEHLAFYFVAPEHWRKLVYPPRRMTINGVSQPGPAKLCDRHALELAAVPAHEARDGSPSDPRLRRIET